MKTENMNLFRIQNIKTVSYSTACSVFIFREYLKYILVQYCTLWAIL